MRRQDSQRIDHESKNPRILNMHFALQRLRSVTSFMNSGAHPDDETSAMLAALSFRDGLNVSYACANRGEGGQNDIGTEVGAALGTLRTAEMERAASVLDMRLYWLSTHTNDSISDFRFSKSGVETLGKWQHAHALDRFVSIIRREKPDILCPTFLDIPGQHGHHRAMTQLAHEAIDAAADDTRTLQHDGQSLPPWTIAKYYLPAWGGGGTAYDDELPPPNATTTVIANDIDQMTGWSWERIGQQSRHFHLTQGMGRWVPAGTERNWPLHLAHTIFTGTDDHITDHLPTTLPDLANYAQAPELINPLTTAQTHIDNAIAAFPDYANILKAANSAISQLRVAQEHCPDHATAQVQHRLSQKISQLSRVVRIASGIDVHAVASESRLRPGQTATVDIEVREPTAIQGDSLSHRVGLKLDHNWQEDDGSISPDSHAVPTDPYPAEYFPDDPRLPAIQISLNCDGVESHTVVGMVNPLIILPQQVVNLASDKVVVNNQSDKKQFSIGISQRVPDDAAITLVTPAGWEYQVSPDTVTVQLPAQCDAGTYELPVNINGHQALTEQLIDYPHAEPRVLSGKAKITVLVLNVILPDKRLAYVGGGNDRIPESLEAMGLPITELDDDALASPGELARFDTIVIGLFAMRTRPVLADNIQSLHQWIENGGHLLTLYHRPWDNWDPDKIPPAHLEIGQPSLRYRVTNESATVTHLQPDHVLLNQPNKITPEDWDHWVKERGLYFAKSWHDDYQPLLSMRDPEEAPLTGSLLSAKVGQGRHTHTSLILHHQMANLVPGGFRLMANLLG